MYVEGLIHITELGGEYYRFDEARQELRGERTGMRYAIGTRVQVQVSRVDLDGRRIDFRLIQDGDDRTGKTLRDKNLQKESDSDHARSGKDAMIERSRENGGPRKSRAARQSTKDSAPNSGKRKPGGKPRRRS
jgi:ribonuclease R